MKIKIALPAALIFAFSSVMFAQSKTASGIRSIDFLNYSYQGTVCAEDAGLPKTVKVRNGKFKDSDNNFFNMQAGNLKESTRSLAQPAQLLQGNNQPGPRLNSIISYFGDE